MVRTLSIEMGLQTIVSNDVRYIKPQDAVSLDLLNCISYGQGLHDPNRDSIPTDQQYFKSETEIKELFPNDIEAIERTEQIAEQCNFKFQLFIRDV